MHVTGEISAGQVIISVPLVFVLMMLMKLHSMMLMFRMEHEILMQEWAGRQTPPIQLHNLHTRQKKWW